MPRALHRLGLLDTLLTDAWADPRSVFSVVGGRRGRDRFHDELRDATVWTPGVSSVFFEGSLRMSGAPAWDTIIERNSWFQDRACEQLEILARQRQAPAVLFAYSYAARRLFTVARAHGWTTVLGQIDPGPVEERLVAKLHQRHPSLAADWRPAPAGYWDNWQEEWRLADRVVVNSEWSRAALREAGVPESLIRIVPLAYEPTVTPRVRNHAPRFDAGRPLRVLFLGQVNLRKGVAEILEAAEQLRGEPVHFTFVGPLQITLTRTMRDSAQISWIGSVAHSAAAAHFDSADVFLFPTHSDGFGLTQLEALAHGLPAIVSRHCAQVITNGVNGLVLDEVSGAAIAASLRELLRDPSRLRAMSEHARIEPSHSLDAVGRHLVATVT